MIKCVRVCVEGGKSEDWVSGLVKDESSVKKCGWLTGVFQRQHRRGAERACAAEHTKTTRRSGSGAQC